MATKITKTDRFNKILSLMERCAEDGLLTEAEHKEYADFIGHEIALLAKKSASTGERKPTAQQKSNAELKQMIYDFIVVDGKTTIAQLMPKLTSSAEITHGRVTALLTQLKHEGKIAHSKKGKDTFFSPVEG